MPKRWLWLALMLGAYLTIRGYQSRDVDQAFRLPLLLHQQNQALYANDPFVRAFDVFNPHAGYLFLLGAVSRIVGVSMALLLLYVCMFGLTVTGIDRITQAVWRHKAGSVGLVAVMLVLAARAGNIGTNHLFESTLLDRLIAMSLGWIALSASIDRPQSGLLPSLCLGVAGVIHPSLGLQLAGLFGISWIVWDLCLPGRPTLSIYGQKYVLLAIGLLPCLILIGGQSARLLEGLPKEEIWQLSVELQSPQHMLPKLWRLPQWAAWFCYIALAALALTERGWNSERLRLVTMLGVVLVALAFATLGIEVFHDLRLTMFQPFRMATWARGLSIVLISGRVEALWSRGDIGGRTRALMIVVGLSGDWMFVMATVVELSAALGELLARGFFRGWTIDPRFESHNGLVPPSHLEAREPRNRSRAQRTTVPHFRSAVASLQRTSQRETHHESSLTESRDRVSTVVSAQSAVVLSRQTVHADATWLKQQPLRWGNILGICVFSVGMVFLYRHDTQQGQWSLLAALIASLMLKALGRPGFRWSTRRVRLAFAAAWVVPVLAFAVPPLVGVESDGTIVRGLATRCRFWAVPIDDVERLAAWARESTPSDAVIVCPPGPKTFRLWSQRAVVFNRAGSPYHAQGLADWARRFKRHVGFTGTNQAFAEAYQSNRHQLESGFDRLTNLQLVELAQEEKATFVMTSSARKSGDGLEVIKSVGKFSLFRVDVRE